MFTGIVEEQGRVVAVEDSGDRLGDALRLRISADVVTDSLSAGDSVAVNGCCLTVVDPGDGRFDADVMRATLDATSLGSLRPGAAVNLERAVTAQTRMGGHLVQGHVDGTGTVMSRQVTPHWHVLRIQTPRHLLRYLAAKGSVAVDGVSLTVVDVDDAAGSFSVSLIPTTLSATTLGTVEVGGRVNLEVDVVAKYVERLLERAPAEQGQEGRWAG